MARRKPEYYIHIDSYWQNAPDRFVGPFDTKKEALAAVEEAMEPEDRKVFWLEENVGQIDVMKDAIRVIGVVGRTRALRAGMIEPEWYGGGNVLSELPRDLPSLRDLEIENELV